MLDYDYDYYGCLAEARSHGPAGFLFAMLP